MTGAASAYGASRAQFYRGKGRQTNPFGRRSDIAPVRVESVEKELRNHSPPSRDQTNGNSPMRRPELRSLGAVPQHGDAS